MLGKQFRQLITNEHLRISVTELANVTGVSTSQIRYWERKGYISSKQSDKNKNHYFSFLTLFRVATIKHYLDQGFTLATAVDKERQRQELGKGFRTFITDQVKAITQLGPKKGEVILGTLTDDPEKEIYAVVDQKGTRLYSRPVKPDRH